MDERKVGRVVRSAAESVYGVAAVVGPSFVGRVAARLSLGRSGVSVVSEPTLRVTIDLRVAPGVPEKQVAENVAEKVRYVVERDLARQIQQLTIRVDGRQVDLPAAAVEPQAEPSAERSAERPRE